MSKPSAQSSPVSVGSSPGILRAGGIAKSFKMGDTVVRVLKNVDLTIRRGEFIAIEGRSGSGKSTLLHILGALEAPDSGSLEYEGQDYTPPPPPSHGNGNGNNYGVYRLAIKLLAMLFGLAGSGVELFYAPGPILVRIICLAIFWIVLLALWLFVQYGRERQATALRNRSFGFVFQFYHLLPELNVLENTLISAMVERSWLGFMASRKDRVARATQILEQMGLSHRLKHRPAQLSGGERQRVAIARALMNEPQILFADEPTGNLDADTGRQIMDVLEKLHREKGQTIVMVTHDRTLAREADRVLVLKDGKLTEAEA